VRIGEIVGLDFEKKSVQLHDGVVTYDYLVIALGVDYTADEVPGLNRTWSFYHPDGTEGLQEHLPTFRGGNVCVVVPRLPYKCPPALYEGTMLLDAYFRKRGIRGDVKMHLYSPESATLDLGGEVSETVARLLAERDIGFTGSTRLKSVDHEANAMEFEDGVVVNFDMVVATPVHKLPHVLEPSGLIGEHGWIAVDREQMNTVAPDVFAIGDCTAIPIGDGQMLPKAAVFAHGQAEVVARNINALIAGKEPIWAFGGQGACFMETGDGKGSYISGNFFTDPPEVTMRNPGRMWHWAKTGFERVWLWRWF
jgi:sulfide:quinone oxidoreductase